MPIANLNISSSTTNPLVAPHITLQPLEPILEDISVLYSYVFNQTIDFIDTETKYFIREFEVRTTFIFETLPTVIIETILLYNENTCENTTQTILKHEGKKMKNIKKRITTLHSKSQLSTQLPSQTPKTPFKTPLPFKPPF